MSAAAGFKRFGVKSAHMLLFLRFLEFIPRLISSASDIALLVFLLLAIRVLLRLFPLLDAWQQQLRDSAAEKHES